MTGYAGIRTIAAHGLVLAASFLSSTSALGHGRSTSTSSFEITEGARPSARITVRAAWADLEKAIHTLAALGATPSALGLEATATIDRYLQERVTLRAAGEPCTPVGDTARAPTADPTHLGRVWQVLCAAPGPLVIESKAFVDTQPAHLHLARVRRGEATPVEMVLVLDRPRVTLAPPDAPAQPQGSSLVDYVILGMEHIFSGTDHLCFLLALLLIGTTLGEVVTVVTGFTAAHSVTLALGVLGLVRPDAGAVEALIGLSIVVVALENFFETTGAPTRRLVRGGLVLGIGAALVGALAGRVAIPALALLGIGVFSLCYFSLLVRAERPARLRWLVAFVFGLVHGFGFAGVLAEIALPAGRTAQALLGFNLGVELGQIALVVALWPLYRWALARMPAARPLVIQTGSAAVLAAGLYWFLTRALGAA